MTSLSACQKSVSLGALALTTLLANPPCGAAAQRTLPTPHGLPALVTLHGPRASAVGAQQVGTWQSSFVLPRHAKQGGSDWYASRLRMQLAVKRRAEPSVVYLSSETNGYTATQVKVEVPPQASKRAVRWTFYGLFGGYEAHTTDRDEFVVDVRNYLQNKGVRPGRNRLAAEIEVLGPMVVRRAAVLRGTSISSGLGAPAKIEVRADTANVSLTKESIALPVRVRNLGGRAEARILLRGDADRNVLLPGGGSTQQIPRLAPGATVDRTLHFRRRGAGRTVLAISVAGATSNAQDRLAIDVPAEKSRDAGLLSLRWPGWLGVFLLAAGAIAFVWPRRWNKQ